MNQESDEMTKVLVKFQADFADEFDVYGHHVMDKHEWQAHMAQAQAGVYPQYLEFGTNEGIEFENFNEYNRAFTVVEVSDDLAEVLEQLFGKYYGHFLMIHDFSNPSEPY